ncbi:uncharacterized protein [Apostichopus japonicus]|uniref:uncharacterized protein n=1 Tax=Stichopus japonicus TaxID=307972 RepID=UPI003AB2B093
MEVSGDIRYKLVFIFLIVVQHFPVFALGQDAHRIELEHDQQPYLQREEAIQIPYVEPASSLQHNALPQTSDLVRTNRADPSSLIVENEGSRQSQQTSAFSDHQVSEGFEDERHNDGPSITDLSHETGYDEGGSSLDPSDEVNSDDSAISGEVSIQENPPLGNDEMDIDYFVDKKTTGVAPAGGDRPPTVPRGNDALSHRLHRGVGNPTSLTSNNGLRPGSLSNEEQLRAPENGQAMYNGYAGPSMLHRPPQKNRLPMSSRQDPRHNYENIKNARSGIYSGMEADGTNSVSNRQGLPHEIPRHTNSGYWPNVPTERRTSGSLSRGPPLAPEQSEDYNAYDRPLVDIRGLEDIPQDAEVSMEGHGWTALDVPMDEHKVPFSPLDDRETSHSLNNEYNKYFSELDDSVTFEIPELHNNCWLQAMMATTWGFSPSCNEDGTYGPKQCHLKRCWCVDRSGRKVMQHGGKTDHGFYFGLRGLTLYCSEN